MPIPDVSAESLRGAMEKFDHELRDTPDWSGWENNRAHLYAIEHEGKRHYARRPLQTRLRKGLRRRKKAE